MDAKGRAISSSTGLYITWKYSSAQGSKVIYMREFWSFDTRGKFIPPVQTALFSELWLMEPKGETEPWKKNPSPQQNPENPKRVI